MDDLLSEKEQIDQIRSWWSEYGGFVIAGIVLGGRSYLGITTTKTTNLQSQIEASQAYETLVGHVADGDLEEAEQVADDIAAAFGDTTYAGPSRSRDGAFVHGQKPRRGCSRSAAGVLNGSADDELKDIARLRLGRIYLYQDKAQEAVDLLEGRDTVAFAAAYGEILGDAYTASRTSSRRANGVSASSAGPVGAEHRRSAARAMEIPGLARVVADTAV